MEAVVQLKNVTKKIKGKTIIDSISFDVYQGEVFGFLGPNGAGKTTTIRMIVGLIGITSGDIYVSGYSVKNHFVQSAQQIGAIVENPEMYKFLSGYENLLHFARMSTKTITKEKIVETIELVGLKDRIHDKVKTYSLGMRQRLGLAQCLLHDPKVLILDEPTNGLDPSGIREIRDYLRKLAKERGMAVIVSSHLLSEMEMMCDRIGIIQNGKLIDVQLVKDFVQKGQSTYFFEVSPQDVALDIIRKAYQTISVTLAPNGLELNIEKEMIPSIIQLLVQNHISIYIVKEMVRTLEDRFLEVTDNEGGVINVSINSK